jgi:hypothetical protein
MEPLLPNQFKHPQAGSDLTHTAVKYRDGLRQFNIPLDNYLVAFLRCFHEFFNCNPVLQSLQLLYQNK